MILKILTIIMIIYELGQLFFPEKFIQYKTCSTENVMQFMKEKFYIFCMIVEFFYVMLLFMFLFTGHVMIAILITLISIINIVLIKKGYKLTIRDRRIDSIICIILLLMSLL